MQSIAAYQHLGVLSFLILLVGLGFILWKWPEGKHLTFSQHVAPYARRILYYILLFSIVLPLLTLFFIGWFVPNFHLSQWFSGLIIASMTAQYACTLVPETGGRRSAYHRLFAGVSALCLLPLLGILLLTSGVSLMAKGITAAAFAVMAFIIIATVISKGKHSHSLYLQAGYFAAFFASILSAVYL